MTDGGIMSPQDCLKADLLQRRTWAEQNRSIAEMRLAFLDELRDVRPRAYCARCGELLAAECVMAMGCRHE
jgi:hypothetical protein